MSAAISNGNPIRISFVGDIALNGGYESLVNEGKTASLVNSLVALFPKSDLVIGNLEGPLTACPASGPPWRFNLRGQPAYAPILRAAGFQVLTLANNHIMDHGWEGLKETLRHLEYAGIQYAGAGRNLSQARKPLLMSVRGVKIAILAYCNVATLSSLYASDEGPGIAPLRRSFVFRDIVAAKKNCDLLTVCIHWGQENIGEPAPKSRRLGSDLIAAGADIIVGHHPHVLQGIERVDGGVIAYSLGNFTFSDEYWHGINGRGESFSMPYVLNESNRRSAIWTVDVVPGSGVIKEELVPLYLGRDLLLTADTRAERKKELLRRNAVLSSPMYSITWLIRMTSGRFGAIMHQLRGERGLWDRFMRLRPHHIRDFFRLLVREWENFRGQE